MLLINEYAIAGGSAILAVGMTALKNNALTWLCQGIYKKEDLF